MRQAHAERRRQQAGRDDQRRAEQADIADRERRQRRHAPTRPRHAQHSRQGDQHAEARRRRHGLVHRAAIERHEHDHVHRAADAHQRRQQADEGAIDRAHGETRQFVAQPPIVARQEQPQRHHRRRDRPTPTADPTGWRTWRSSAPPMTPSTTPGAIEVTTLISTAPLALCSRNERSEVGRMTASDVPMARCMRMAGIDADGAQHLVEHGHQDGAAADAQQPGEEARGERRRLPRPRRAGRARRLKRLSSIPQSPARSSESPRRLKPVATGCQPRAAICAAIFSAHSSAMSMASRRTSIPAPGLCARSDRCRRNCRPPGAP